MSSYKCVECGLVNFAGAQTCKRCAVDLATQRAPVIEVSSVQAPVAVIHPTVNFKVRPCPACNHIVARDAPACPQCGKVLKRSRAGGIVAGLVVVCVLLWALGAQKADDKKDLNSQLIVNTSTNRLPVPVGPFQHSQRIETEFDRFQNYTTVTLDSAVIEDEPKSLRMSAYFLYHGQTLKQPDSLRLRFTSDSEGWIYLNHHTFSVLADGKPVKVGAADHDGTVGSGYVLEFMGVDVEYETFLQIVSAKEVEFRLGSKEIKLTSGQLEALRDLVSRTQPA